MSAGFAADRSILLGRAGHKLALALLALEVDEARHAPGRGPDCAAWLQAAADRLWEFVVQREACGLTDHALLDAHYAIPAAVWRRTGICRAAPQSPAKS